MNVFTTHTHKIAGKATSYQIVPFGDVHYDAPCFCKDTWKAFIKEAKALEGTVLFLGMGDYMDMASFKERKQLRDLHESTKQSLDDLIRVRLDEFLDDIAFMKGRMLGFIGGNHEWEFSDGTTGTDYIAKEMGCRNLGWATYIRITSSRSNTGIGSSHALDIFASHGKGAGKLVGTPYNTVEQMRRIFPSASIYCMGHDHNRGALCDSVLTVSKSMAVQQQRQWLCRTGSFLRGFVVDQPSYVVGKMLSPTDLGTVRFQVKGRRHTSASENRDALVMDITCIN